MIARRLVRFAAGWMATLGLWMVVFAIEGHLGPIPVALTGAAGLLLVAAIRVVAADPAAPRVVPVTVAACVGLGLAAMAMVAAVGAYGEIFAFILLTLYLAAALVFAWGWRAELVLLLATLGPWALVFDRFRFFVPGLELGAAVAIGAGVALVIAEGTARNARQVWRRRRAEEEAIRALAASRDAYRDLAEHAPDMIWACDLEGRITYANEALAHFTGSSAPEIVGRLGSDFWTDHPANPTLDGWIAGVPPADSPIAVECRTPRGPRWVEVVVSTIVGPDGVPVGFRGLSRDVQERRAAEAALRASEERFRSAFDHAAIGMVVVGSEGRPLEVNPAFVDMLGYTPAELLGRTMDSLAHPDDVAAATVETMRLIMGEIRAFQMEKRYVHRDGHLVWGLLSCSLTRDALGQPMHLIAQIQDISERKTAEAALRTSEGRYRSLVESQREWIVRMDLDGRITFVNDAYVQTFGGPREAILGQTRFDLVHSNDRVMVAEALASLTEPPHRVGVECRILTVAGQRWASWEGRLISDGNGQPVEIQAVGLDVTESHRAETDLRESEERFRRAFEDAAIGMLVTTIDGRTIRANRAFCAMVGYTESELQGRVIDELVHPDDRAVVDVDRTRLTMGVAAAYRGERRYIRKDGQPLRVNVTVSIVRSETETPLYLVGQIQDVTEQYLAETALKASMHELQRSEEKLRLLARRQVAIREEERKRLGFDLHDDVCQELVGVGILVESLRRKLVPMPAEQAAEFERVIGYLGEVGEHLRVLAHELRPFLLQDLGLDGSLGSLAAGMSTTTLAITTHVVAPIPRLDEETETTVYRIAQEALTNAVRHAGARAIAVSLAIMGDELTLAVHDDGCGFDPAARPAMALGLASMEERALALGGRLEIRSEPDEGTTVSLRCPVDVVGAGRVKAPEGSSPTRSSFPPSRVTRRRAAARD